jgi:hypothetical protein
MVNYKIYVDEIIDIMHDNTDFSYNRIVFQGKGNKIGKEIYKVGGYKGLFIVMELVQKVLIENGYSDEYLTDLRELEFSFNGICDEFQA